MSTFYSNTYQGQPGTVNIRFPYEQISLPQLEGYELDSPQYFTELPVLDGPARRRYDRPVDIFRFRVSFICIKRQAEAFEGFYYDTIDQGMKWFKMPLSTGSGMRSCTVREVQNTPYVMTKIGPHFRYEWELEGYRGVVIDDEFLPPIIVPPDDPIIDFYDGQDSAFVHTDTIDALTSAENLIEFISGGNAQS